MKILISVLSILLFNSSFSQTTELDVKISCKSVIKSGEDLFIEIAITNNTTFEQKFLFDKPHIVTGGPWKTIVSLNKIPDNVSILKYNNRALMSSDFYKTEELEKHYYTLKPNQTISKKYSLLNLVWLNSEDEKISPGKYEMKIWFDGNESNVVYFNVI
jgi:hypothetical protein